MELNPTSTCTYSKHNKYKKACALHTQLHAHRRPSDWFLFVIWWEWMCHIVSLRWKYGDGRFRFIPFSRLIIWWCCDDFMSHIRSKALQINYKCVAVLYCVGYCCWIYRFSSEPSNNIGHRYRHATRQTVIMINTETEMKNKTMRH